MPRGEDRAAVRGRCDRIIRSALHQAEQTLTPRVTARLAAAADDDDEADAAMRGTFDYTHVQTLFTTVTDQILGLGLRA